jgi:hypothetical protein
MGGQLDCAIGPDCYYARLVDEGEGASLAAEGIVDAASLEGAIWMELGQWLVILTGLSLAGALAAATWRALRSPPAGAMPDPP